MRKLIKLGVLAILLSWVASPVLASVEECEKLKDDNYTKGLHGLCVAYWSTTKSDIRDKILQKYNDKAGPNEGMPGLNEVFCPCWTLTELSDAINKAVPEKCGTTENENDTSFDFALYGKAPVVKFEAGGLFRGIIKACSYADNYGYSFKPVGYEGVTVEHIQDCRDQIRALAQDFRDVQKDCEFFD